MDKLRSIGQIGAYRELPSNDPRFAAFKDTRTGKTFMVPRVMGGATTKMKILIDNELRVVAAGTVNGTAQAKGTATDCFLAIIVGQDGASAFAAGTTAAPAIQGAQASGFASPTAVTPDKGSLPANFVAVGLTVVHLAQLQYAFYRLQIVATGAPVMDVSCAWIFTPMVDSFDDSVQ